MESSRPAVLLQASAAPELAYLPTLITVATDVLAGYWIANGTRIDSRLLWLLLGTSAVYAAGCALNEYSARAADPPERPGRPIPGGRAEPWKALGLSSALFAAGLGASVLAGGSSPYITALLILAAVLYHTGAREKIYFGPLTVAGYRALNLILGMGVPFWLGDEGLPGRYFPVFSFLYVFLLSWLSRFDAGGKSREIAAGAFLGWAHFIAILLSLSFWGAMSLESLPFLALFAAFTGPALLKAGQLQTPFAAGGAMKAMVLAIPLLNAVYCSAVQGLSAGVPVALCAGVAAALALGRQSSGGLARRSGWGRESF
jgi:4-hydroxybenzoate polyprenyltransferase